MKKLISLLVAVMLVLSLTPSAFATTFVGGKTADELTREELLENLTTWVKVDGWETRAEELSTEQLRQIYQKKLDDFNKYLANGNGWLTEVQNDEGQYILVGPASKFVDVPEDAWYLDELHYAVGNGYISGTGSNTFSPSGNITRGQFVTILGRMLGIDASSGVTKFVDVPETAWYAPYVRWAADMGVVNGISVNEFSPETNISFEQMAVMLENYLTKSGVSISEAQSTFSYKDLSSVSIWARSGVDAARLYGLIKPDANGNLNPQKAVTRADGAVALVNLARATGLGEEPEFERKSVASADFSSMSATEKAHYKANIIHDELWASGSLNSAMTEKEKAAIYFRWMCLYCSYHDSDQYPNRHTAYGALVDGVGVCDGLSYAYAMLLATENIKCNCIPDWEHHHMYNEVYLDGEWYEIGTNVVNFTRSTSGEFVERYYNQWYVNMFSHSIDNPVSADW